MLKFFYLFLSIVFEVAGTISLKLSDGYTKILPTISMAVCYIICFYFLSRCMNQFASIGYVYAVWSGIGICFITIIGIYLFDNKVDMMGILGLSFIIIGAVVLNLFSKMSH